MTNSKAIKSYSEYKKLSKDEKELWQFERFLKIDTLFHKIEDLDKKFAGKWVEKGAVMILTLMVVTVVGGILTLVIK